MELNNLCQFVGILVKKGENTNNLHVIFCILWNVLVPHCDEMNNAQGSSDTTACRKGFHCL